MVKETKKPVFKKLKRKFSRGIMYIHSSFNNTIITLTNLKGDVLTWSSPGCSGFKGARKNTPFSVKMVADNILKKCFEIGLLEVKIFVKGPGPGREIAVRHLQKSSLHINTIQYITPIPHNGCRPPKKRRI